MVRKQQTELENLFQEALRAEVGEQRYQLWFGPNVRFAFEGNQLSVQVDTPFMVDWMNKGYAHLFKKIGLELFGRAIEVSVSSKENVATRLTNADASDLSVQSPTVPQSASGISSAAHSNSNKSDATSIDQLTNEYQQEPNASLFASEPFPYSTRNGQYANPLSSDAPSLVGFSDPVYDKPTDLYDSDALAKPIKRGRGRPRKNLERVFVAEVPSASQSAQTFAPVSYYSTDPYATAVPYRNFQIEQPKRKRGRPRKNSTSEQTIRPETFPNDVQTFDAPILTNALAPRSIASYPTRDPHNSGVVVQPTPALDPNNPALNPPRPFFEQMRTESQARYQSRSNTTLSQEERDALAVGIFAEPRQNEHFALYDAPGAQNVVVQPKQVKRGRPKGALNRSTLQARGNTQAETEENVLRDERGFNVVTRPKEQPRVKVNDDRIHFASLNTFVRGFSNQLARNVIEVALTQPNVMSPIFIYGPTSVGKTHLLEGVCDAYSRMRDLKPPLYMTGEQFTSAFIHSLRGGAPFRDRFNNISLFALDDVHFLEGKFSTQIELLNVFDYLRIRRVQMVFSSNKPLTELNNLRGELTTRLESGVVCKIDSPERETLATLLRNMALERRVILSDDVCRYVVSRFATNARQLSGALNKLIVEQMTTGAVIDMQLARNALADLMSVNFRNVKLDDVERVVQEVFGLESNSLKSSSRAKKCADPRAIAMWIARKHTRNALAEIGQFFGGRKHSAVLSAQKKVDEWLLEKELIEVGDASYTVNEAVERVERALAYPRS